MALVNVSASLVSDSELTPSLSQHGNYGGDLFGASPYGGTPDPFGAVSATSLSDFSVEITFNDLLDFTYLPNLETINYSIPGLTVLSVSQYTAASVQLQTTAQTNVTYTCTISQSRGYFDESLNPALSTVTFQGQQTYATMVPVAVSPTKVRLVFSEPMLDDVSLSSPLSYTVTDMFGNSFTVVSATPEQTTNVVSVALVLSTDLVTDGIYQATVSGSVHTVSGIGVSPGTVKFTWVQEMPNPILIPFQEFTGEISDSIFGNPAGLVFFSPALNASAANSVIQVEEVDVCTTAFDTYSFPQPVDPIPLFTYGVGRPAGSVLGPGGASLWAPFPRMSPAQFILSNSGLHQNDIFHHATDGMALALLKSSTWNLTYVALLNNPAFLLHEPPPATPLPMPPPPATVPVTPVLFITANNLSPIPTVDSESFRFLSFGLVGQSSMTATMSHSVGLAASLVGGSGFITIPVNTVINTALSTLNANASVNGAGKTSIQGGSNLSATLTVGP